MAKQRPGKREREARKRRKRLSVTFNQANTESGWLTLKLGRKKSRESLKKHQLPF